MGVYICFLSKCIINVSGQKKSICPMLKIVKRLLKKLGIKLFLEVQSEDLLDDTSFRVVEDRDKVLEFRVKSVGKMIIFFLFSIII